MSPFSWSEGEVEKVLGVTAEVSETDQPYEKPRTQHIFRIERDHYKFIFGVIPSIGKIWVDLSSSQSNHHPSFNSLANVNLTDCQGINYVIIGGSDTLEIATRFSDPLEFASDPSMSTSLRVSVQPDFRILYSDFPSHRSDSN